MGGVISSIFGGGSKSNTPPPAPTPVDATAANAAAEQARQQQARAQGYQSTILTSGQDDQASIASKKKNLLGL